MREHSIVWNREQLLHALTDYARPSGSLSSASTCVIADFLISLTARDDAIEPAQRPPSCDEVVAAIPEETWWIADELQRALRAASVPPASMSLDTAELIVNFLNVRFDIPTDLA